MLDLTKNPVDVMLELMPDYAKRYNDESFLTELREYCEELVPFTLETPQNYPSVS